MEMKYKILIEGGVNYPNIIYRDICDLTEHMFFNGIKTNILPYIGLKDKNGNKIYLNDDVSCFINGNSFNLRVDFMYGSFVLSNNDNWFLSFIQLLNDKKLTIKDNCIQQMQLIKEAQND